MITLKFTQGKPTFELKVQPKESLVRSILMDCTNKNQYVFDYHLVKERTNPHPKQAEYESKCLEAINTGAPAPFHKCGTRIIFTMRCSDKGEYTYSVTAYGEGYDTLTEWMVLPGVDFIIDENGITWLSEARRILSLRDPYVE